MSWTCPKCERRLRNKNQWHSCVNQNLDGLFAGKPDELLLAFDKVLAQVAEWPNVHISTTKNCIVFVTTQTFLVIKPMQKVLNIKFYADEKIHHPLIFKTNRYGKQLEHHVRISEANQANDELLALLKTSHALFT